MKIKLLLASDDLEYAEHLSKTLSNNYSEVVEVNICTSLEKLIKTLKENKYDVALLEAGFCENIDTSGILLPVMLWTEGVMPAVPKTFKTIRKFQRISAMFAEIMENFSKVSTGSQGLLLKKASITAVWSPSGGVGKTTVALALAVSEATKEKQVMYINFEPFSSTPVYFDIPDKSISILFEMLEAKEGNLDALIQSILRKDSASGIAYFGCPESLDDMNIISANNISELLHACSGAAQELVIDMSCICDGRTRCVFELADRILLVSDWTSTSRIKLNQFMARHNVFPQIKDKIQVIANKGAILEELPVKEIVSLPLLESIDETRVFKVLSTLLN